MRKQAKPGEDGHINLWAVLLLVAALAAAVYLAGRRTPDPDYWVEREAYDEAVEARDAELAMATDHLAALSAELALEQAARIKALDEQARLERENQALVEDGRELEQNNARLRTELEPVIAANPRLRELIAGYDLALLNRDAQIFNLKASYARAKDEAEASFKSYLNAASQAAVWKKQYEDEHALRLAGDALRLGLENRYKTSRFWATIGKWGPPAAFALGLIFGG